MELIARITEEHENIKENIYFKPCINCTPGKKMMCMKLDVCPTHVSFYEYDIFNLYIDENEKIVINHDYFHENDYRRHRYESKDMYVSDSFITSIAGDAYRKCDIKSDDLAGIIYECIANNKQGKCRGVIITKDITNDIFEAIRDHYFITKHNRSERRIKEKQEEREYRYVIDDLDGVIVGIDKKLDITDKDFSVRLILRSSYDFAKRKKIFSEKKNEIIEYVKKEIEKDKRKMKKIGDFSYYYCSEIILLRVAEAEMIFSIKGT